MTELNFIVMNKKKVILGVLSILIIGFGIWFYNSNYCVVFGNNVETALESKLGDEYPNVLNLNYYKLGNMYIVNTVDYKNKDWDINMPPNQAKGNEVSYIIGYLNKIPYMENQNDPNKALENGANCQAYALMFRDMCRQYEIPCKIEHTTDHMYDVIQLDGKSYKIDLVNNIMEEQKG